MTLYTKIFILFTLLAQEPQLLSGWPQRNPRQQPTPPVPMSTCNVTFVAESRAARPPFPDPTMEGDDAAKERTDRVIFPDQKSPPSTLNFPDGLRDRTGTAEILVPQVPSMDRAPSCAAGSTFCTDSDNYPRNHVKKFIMTEGLKYRDFFGEDVKSDAKNRLSAHLPPPAVTSEEEITTWEATPIEPNITQRLDTSPDESPFCMSLEQVVYPKMALNKDDKWLFIVNQDQFVQGVRVEKCLKEGPCTLSETLPNGYKTSCRQKYIYRKLLSLNSDGKAISDSFRIPSCCACYFRMTSVASRFGSHPQTTLLGRGNRGGQSPITQPSTQLSRPGLQTTPRSGVTTLSQDKVTRSAQSTNSSTTRQTKLTNDSRTRA